MTDSRMISSSVIGSLVPGDVAVAEVLGDDPTAYLLAEEEHLVAKAVEKRRREFTTARTSARRALAKLGQPEVAILSGSRRQPLWPEGIVGSITHCKGFSAAAVARDDTVLTVGIDAEVSDVLPEGVLAHVSCERERELLAKLAADQHWDRILFSAKESVYKAWFPLVGRWLGFEDAFVTIDPAHGSFRAELLVEPPTVGGYRLSEFEGRFMCAQGLVATAITVAVGGQ